MSRLLKCIGKTTAVLALVISAGCETYPSRTVYVPGYGWADSENENVDEIRYNTQRELDKENEFQKQRGEAYNRALENRDKNMEEVERMHRRWLRDQRR